MSATISHALAQLWLHVHDVSVSALAVAVAILGLVLLLELRCVVRLRGALENSQARVFEQLDLLRFETQQLIEAQQASVRSRDSALAGVAAGDQTPLTVNVSAVPTVPVAIAAPALSVPASPEPAPAAAPPAPPVPGAVYQSAAAMAARGVSSREIAQRLGLANGEARLLSSIAQARARRAEAASA